MEMVILGYSGSALGSPYAECLFQHSLVILRTTLKGSHYYIYFTDKRELRLKKKVFYE